MGRFVERIDWRLTQENPGDRYIKINEHAALDQNFNIYTTATTEEGFFVYRADWVDEPAVTPALPMGPLDGFYRVPKAPREKDVRPSVKTEKGHLIEFHYPERKTPTEEGPYPVYNLFNYQLSHYQEENPGAILGYVDPGWVPWPLMSDFREMDRGIFAFVPDIHRKAENPEKGKRAGKSGRKKEKRGTFVYEIAKGQWNGNQFFGYDTAYTNGITIMTPSHPGESAFSFDPGRPDVLPMVDMPQFRLNVPVFETGADTKTFVTATFWTGLRLTPKELPPAWPRKFWSIR